MSEWRQGFSKSICFALFLAVIVLICAGASAAIVTISDNKMIEGWMIRPSVVLAVLSSVVNVSLATMLSIAVAVCWWRTALHGTTAASLHYIWERGMVLNIFSALFAGLDVNKVVAVTVIVAITRFINNPLLQRATDVQVRQNTVVEEKRLDLAQMLPDGWMGKQSGRSSELFISSADSLSAVQRWWQNEPITTLDQPLYYCNGTCEGEVEGAGISYNCIPSTKNLDVSPAKVNGSVVFAVNSTIPKSLTGLPSMLMTVLYASALDDNCAATLSVENCNIKYPVIIQKNIVTLNSDKLLNMEVVSIYNSPGDLSTTSLGDGIGPLKGLDHFLNDYFGSEAKGYFNPSRNWSIYDGKGTVMDLFYEAHNSSYNSHTLQSCRFKWSSPTEYLLSSMIRFMFLAALHAGNGTHTEVFEAKSTPQTLTFRSNYSYLAGALAAMLLSLAGVLFLLWGWWEIKRPVSLSPLETAKAFEAPLMQSVGRRECIDEILDEIRRKRLRYDRTKIVVESGIEMQSTRTLTRETTPVESHEGQNITDHIERAEPVASQND